MEEKKEEKRKRRCKIATKNKKLKPIKMSERTKAKEKEL